MAKGGIRISRRAISEVKKLEVRYGELLESVHAIVWRAEAPTFQTTYARKHAEVQNEMLLLLKAHSEQKTDLTFDAGAEEDSRFPIA